jgi:DNA adenine methylase
LKKIRPIIKWTGGKFDEFPNFSSYLPRFSNYYEPFFGGGGTFFALRPAGKSFLNDKSSDLVNFYKSLNAPSFEHELTKYADAWEQLTIFSHQAVREMLPLFQKTLSHQIDQVVFSSGVKSVLFRLLSKGNTLLADETFILYPHLFFEMLLSSVLDKGSRLKRISAREHSQFSDSDLADHIETGIKSGYYFFMRHLMNLQSAGSLEMNELKAAATWYFIREFCYASMFRYSRAGKFNIPYGGIAYNKKNFRLKVENVFSHEVRSLFAGADFYNLDFEQFLHQTAPTGDDFIFLDPPYDSRFSEYDRNTFSKADQHRLRDTLFTVTAKWMMVIKETDYIRSLYTSSKCTLVEFDKTYTYNVRGRNNRETRHLIILNYDATSR